MNLARASAPAVLFVTLLPVPAAAEAVPGEQAPDFRLTDIEGKTHRLAEYRGRHVVLEWFNQGCPFVQKHYESGNMQALQRRYTAAGVVWLAVNSTNPTSSDYRDPQRSKTLVQDWKMAPSALMLDEDGKVGQAYGARATPHMFVIDPKGRVIYAGAIDDKATWRVEYVKDARNWVATALDEAMAGKAVSRPSTAPYGCSVKY